ncbi:MAG TPA: PAS domain S-box protein, partial [Armatimonadota bacterium]|nr:PAS domain S-box protein [Armatimonadota bacterium]
MNKARKVLVVNDDTKSEYIEILKSAGYQVEVANSEEKAKQNLESDNYDLIVSAPGAAERLDLQHELFHAIIDTIPVMIVIYDPHLNTFQFNKNFRDVLGWTEADAVDGDFMEKVYPDPEYRQMATEYMQSLEPGWRDFKTTAKDGSEVESSWANIKLSDDTIVGIGVDIRERKQAEEKLGSVALFPDENPNPV